MQLRTSAFFALLLLASTASNAYSNELAVAHPQDFQALDTTRSSSIHTNSDISNLPEMVISDRDAELAALLLELESMEESWLEQQKNKAKALIALASAQASEVQKQTAQLVRAHRNELLAGASVATLAALCYLATR